MPNNVNWLADREAEERRWHNWRKRVVWKGVSLSVTVPFEAFGWAVEKRFGFEYRDKFGGTFFHLIRRPLLRRPKGEVLRLLKSSLAKLPIADCRVCGRRAIVDKGNCRSCFLAGYRRQVKDGRAQSRKDWNARAQSLREKGYRYVARVWIHRNDRDDYCVEADFKTKPTAAQLRSLARKNKSVVLGDWQVLPLKKSS
jgi:hypothetical protein